ncbi:MAG: protoporphyrinogen oxidase [Candidatus Marsarchaeota archaeon]|nr:protoporphyrinogen oxidase [Candidatus Marsarchaeota archaeon]
MARRSRSVVVIGGGVSGLSTAYYINRLWTASGVRDKLDVTVLERSGGAGGKIATERRDGFVIELGPDSVFADGGAFTGLCAELGISGKTIAPAQRSSSACLLLGGALKELPRGLTSMLPTALMPILTSDILSPVGKLRASMELFVPRGRGGDESAAAFVRRRFGNEVYERIAEPLMCGIHAGDPARTSMRSAFPSISAMEARRRSLILGAASRGAAKQAHGSRPAGFVALDAGMSGLTDALARALGGSVRTNSAVESVSIGNVAENRHTVVLRGGTTMRADAVVMAVPAYDSAALVEQSDPELARMLNSIEYRSVAIATLAYKSADVRERPVGSGFLVPRIEGSRLSAVTWSSMKWAGRAPPDTLLARCFFNDAYGGEALYLDDDSLVQLAHGELAKLFGIGAAPILSRVQRWRRGMPQYTMGHAELVGAIADRLHEHSGLFMTGAWIDGVGIPRCLSNATKTANEVFDYISNEMVG